jgi:hypothetical protein
MISLRRTGVNAPSGSGMRAVSTLFTSYPRSASSSLSKLWMSSDAPTSSTHATATCPAMISVRSRAVAERLDAPTGASPSSISDCTRFTRRA